MLFGGLVAGAIVWVWMLLSPPVSGIYLVNGGTGVVRLKREGYSVTVLEAYQFGLDDHQYESWQGQTFSKRLTFQSLEMNAVNRLVRWNLRRSDRDPHDWDLVFLEETSFGWLNRTSAMVGLGGKPTKTPTREPLQRFLHRVEDEQIIQYFELTWGDELVEIPGYSKPMGAAVSPNAEDLVTLAESIQLRFPDDLFVRTLVLDALIRSHDAEGLGLKLALWSDDYERTSDTEPLLYRQYEHAKFQCEGFRASEQGTNAVHFIPPFNGIEGDFPPIKESMAKIGACTHLVAPMAPTSWHFMILPSLDFRGVKAMALMASTKSHLLLASGKRTEALELARNTFRFGQLIERSDKEFLAQLIGTGVKNWARKSLEFLLNNTTETLDEVRALAAVVNELRAFDTGFTYLDKSEADVVPPNTIGEPPNFAEGTLRFKKAELELDMLRIGIEVRNYLVTMRRFPIEEGLSEPLSDFTAPIPQDTFASTSVSLQMKYNATSDSVLLYSVGPDQVSNLGELVFNPSNGMTSAGDIVLEITRKPRFPYPREGIRATTTATVAGYFPHGLPLDPFKNELTFTLEETSGTAYLVSVGPDEEPTGSPGSETPAGLIYDPTNGIVSPGDLYIPLQR